MCTQPLARQVGRRGECLHSTRAVDVAGGGRLGRQQLVPRDAQPDTAGDAGVHAMRSGLCTRGVVTTKSPNKVVLVTVSVNGTVIDPAGDSQRGLAKSVMRPV